MIQQVMRLVGLASYITCRRLLQEWKSIGVLQLTHDCLIFIHTPHLTSGKKCRRRAPKKQQVDTTAAAAAAMATTKRPFSLLFLVLVGLCGLVHGFVIPSAPLPSAPPGACRRYKAPAAPQGLLPAGIPTLLLRAAADGSAEVGAVESCRRKIQDALVPVQLVVRLT